MLRFFSIMMKKWLLSHIGAGGAQWWERLPSTNVFQVQFPGPASYVDWVFWFCSLLREVFLRVLQFSPLLKKQHLIWFDMIYLTHLFDSFIWFDWLGLQSPQLVEHSCSPRTIRDLNKAVIIIIVIKNSTVVIKKYLSELFMMMMKMMKMTKMTTRKRRS